VETRYDSAGTVISTNYIDYEYDALNRLTEETRDSDNDSVRSGDDYVADYDFDLAGNRHSKILDAADNSKDETITYYYDDRDRLESEDSNNISAHDFAYVYNDNGSMTDKGSSTYAWDLRNRMASATVGGTTTAYGYDESGQRVSQQTGSGNATYFLNDRQNPSASPQVLEEKTGATVAAANLSRSYVLGLEPDAQADTHGTMRFVSDGHGSDRGLVNSTGKLVERYDFDGFGLDVSLAHIDPSTSAITAITSATAWTIQLFGGDAEYDPASGFYYHDARWRDGFNFISYDSFEADPSSPADLHKYLYGCSNPIYYTDPTGHWDVASTLVTAGIAGLIGGFTNVGIHSFINYREGKKWNEDIWSTFFKGSISSGLSTMLIVPTGPVVATSLGNFVSGVFVDYFDGDIAAKGWKTVVMTEAIGAFTAGLFAGVTFKISEFMDDAFEENLKSLVKSGHALEAIETAAGRVLKATRVKALVGVGKALERAAAKAARATSAELANGSIAYVGFAMLNGLFGELNNGINEIFH